MTTIEVQNLSKKFLIQHQKTIELKEKLVGLVKGQRFTREEFWALKDVSIHVNKGETVGLIGENGSGKSTLLKVIARILKPNAGHVRATGRVAALLELGAGFNPNLTGRENIYLNSSLLGFKKKEIQKKVKSIISFSELERFIDTPIKVYSSGMYVRLGFSIAIHVDPDILLIDEILAVGDESFQKKCLTKINQFREQGKTILYVSHALDSVRALCDRVYLLHGGRIRTMGSPDDAIREYRKSLGIPEEDDIAPVRETGMETGKASRAPAGPEPSLLPEEAATGEISEEEAKKRTEAVAPSRWGNGDVTITDVIFMKKSGEETGFFHTGERFIARIRYRCKKPVTHPVFGVAIYTSDGLRLNGPNTKLDKVRIKKLKQVGYLDYIAENFPLLTGDYLFTVAVYNEDMASPYDHLEKYFNFKVVSDKIHQQQGVVNIPCRWSVR